MTDSKEKPDSAPIDDEQLLSPTKPAVKEKNDAMYLVFMLFMLHGIGILLPWNTFINAREYFMDYKLNTTTSHDAFYRTNFMNYVGLSAQLPNMLMSAFNVFFQSTKPTAQVSNDIPKLMLVIVVEIVVCFATVMLAILDSTGWPRQFFDLTIVSVIILNCCTGVYQSSVFNMAAVLPMLYSNAIVIGNNICGTLIAVVNIVSKLLSANDLQLTAICYFSFVILLLIGCFVSLIVLPKLEFYHYYQTHSNVQAIELKPKPEESKEEKHLLESTVVTENTTLDITDDCNVQVVVVDSGDEEDGFLKQNIQTAKECCAMCCIRGNSHQACRHYWLRYWLAFKDSWVHCLSVWSVFFCTLSCFPTITSSVVPLQLTAMRTWFTDFFVFLFFNAFAMLGNICTNFVQFPPPRWLAPVVWVRTLVFIPFFLLCNCYPDRRSVLPVVITSDYAFIIGMILFAFTSGYLSSLCMMYAPRCVRKPEHAGLAAMVAAFFLVFGIFCGISFGTFLSNVIQVD